MLHNTPIINHPIHLPKEVGIPFIIVFAIIGLLLLLYCFIDNRRQKNILNKKNNKDNNINEEKLDKGKNIISKIVIGITIILIIFIVLVLII